MHSKNPQYLKLSSTRRWTRNRKVDKEKLVPGKWGLHRNPRGAGRFRPATGKWAWDWRGVTLDPLASAWARCHNPAETMSKPPHNPRAPSRHVRSGSPNEPLLHGPHSSSLPCSSSSYHPSPNQQLPLLLLPLSCFFYSYLRDPEQCDCAANCWSKNPPKPSSSTTTRTKNKESRKTSWTILCTNSLIL